MRSFGPWDGNRRRSTPDIPSCSRPVRTQLLLSFDATITTTYTARNALAQA